VGTVVALGQRVIWPLAALWVRPVSAGALALAGIYQLTSWKRLCLTHCRNHSISSSSTGGRAGGSLLMGVHHGSIVSGVALIDDRLVVLGMMSPLWMVTIGLIVLLRRVLPVGENWRSRSVSRWLAASIAVGLGWISTGMSRWKGCSMAKPVKWRITLEHVSVQLQLGLPLQLQRPSHLWWL